MAKLINLYFSNLAKHPYKTQAITTGTLMGLGDGISQLVIEKTSMKDYDFKRTARFLTIGTLILGPSLRKWYLTMDKFVASKPIGIVTLKKVILDQTIFAPVILPIIMGSLIFWKTYDVDIVKEKLKQEYIGALFTGYKIWPAAQLINFYFIPFHHRVLFTNFIGLFWNIYLAYITERQGTSSHVIE